ncbi:MAG: hypothetical protein SFV55_20345 [Haliscomenobacter sp.]|uniref:hypothetical protein n=1 Tax=Haliscomenobacter sp. TaxID=2717303 RepID=UPI0029B2EE19|nr:hypothetical protein [Haliscomenobacter sp.]MDX2070791.1 hypothetical protein [Haliscomenobacter sp.]
MARPSKIQHPLLNRPGSSQRKRLADSFALKSEYAPIDSRSLADLLGYIHQYARQIVFYEQKRNEQGEEYTELSNWLAFFENSLPFRMVRFSKTDFDQLEQDLLGILSNLEQNPSLENLKILLDFSYYELLLPIDHLQKLARSYEFDLVSYLEGAIRTTLLPAVLRFILLSNTSLKYLCVGKRNFTNLTQAPWSLPIEDIFSTDESIKNIPGGNNGAILWLKEEASKLIYQLLGGLKLIAYEIPHHLEAGLEALKSRNEPHLGLLFAFIRLFRYFQGDLNQLTQAHLDFFYQHVLQIKPKGVVPDQAHLVFEIAKHLESYPIKKNTAFKDGKDANNADIVFQTDEEIVIDKAQIKDLKTLYLNQVNGKVEGVYIAPVANSADGKGEKFKDEQSKNWATLGSKPSKYIAPGKDTPENNPFGRIGFVLASPVLWLNEGRRDVTITINCEDGGNRDIFTPCFEKYKEFTSKTFYQINERVIIKIENLFSAEAKSFLQEELDKSTPVTIENIDAFLNDRFPFTPTEKTLLEGLVSSEVNGKFSLHEMPFASLIRFFNLLLLQQNPYPIGYDYISFFAIKDPITCMPLLEDERVLKVIEGTLDRSLENKSLFSLQFSGEEGWFTPKGALPIEKTPFTIYLTPASGNVQLIFNSRIEPDEPKVAFYHPEAIKENFKIEHPFPMVKIELNPEIQLLCENAVGEKNCCLDNLNQTRQILTSLYHYFRHLTIKNVKIDVQVCGVKNLIVQNEESLQDVNSPILPFGTRPKLGSTFYIGSKEIFCKNWQKFWISTEWKDLPSSLSVHYRDYDYEPFEDGSPSINNNSFKFKAALLEDRTWKDFTPNPNILFQDKAGGNACERELILDSIYYKEFNRTEFSTLIYKNKSLKPGELEYFNVNSDKAFLRIALDGVSFQHDRYAFVLARRMFQLAGMVDPVSINAMRINLTSAITHRNTIETLIRNINSDITTLGNLLENQIQPALNLDSSLTLDLFDTDGIIQLLGILQTKLDAINTAVLTSTVPSATDVSNALGLFSDIEGKISTINSLSNDMKIIIDRIKNRLRAIDDPTTPATDESGVLELLDKLQAELSIIQDLLRVGALGLPKEPYTPTIKSLILDYTATADNNDIELIHLYPFANSSKTEYLTLKPTLLPTFTDEGSLFIGLENLRPGSNLHLLFQFAEATADSESKRALIHWHYLSGNRWQPLRTGFELLEDATERMTRSGIVKIAVPRDISNTGNTLMPPTADNKHLFWLKLAAPQSVAAVAEVIGIHTQSALSTYQLLPNSEIARVGTALEPMKIAKPLLPDFSIKKLEQPYESFGGQLPEAQGHLYTRVSEHLRHKGRGIDTFDIEHLVLEAFPQLFKCKCISHTFGLSANQYRRDLEVAPGFIAVAVIPDLTKLKAGDGLEPKVPVSMLSAIKEFLSRNTSPFARIKVLNPRFEKIKVDVKVRLMPGRDENYYTAQLKTDLTHFLAPWYLGNSDKLSFGQTVVYSDVLGFIERLDYIDFITALKLIDTAGVEQNEIVPLTARSILTGGEICIDLDRKECPQNDRPNDCAENWMNRKRDPFPKGVPQTFLKHIPEPHPNNID